MGKTALLTQLSDAGEHVVDLEALAGHRGCAFCGLGRPPQPAQAWFDRAVCDALAGRGRPVYVQDEGAFVGSLTVPPSLSRRIATAPVVEIIASLPARVARLVGDYGALDPACQYSGGGNPASQARDAAITHAPRLWDRAQSRSNR